MRARSLDRLKPWLERLQPLMFQRIELEQPESELAGIFRHYPRLILVLNHGPLLGPLHALTGLGMLVLRIGAKDRKPFGLAAQNSPSLAGTRPWLDWVRDDSALAVERLEAGPWTDCLCFPEAGFSQAGDGLHLQPFRDDAFARLALRLDLPVLLVAHHGTGVLDRRVTTPASLARVLPGQLARRIAQTGSVSLPWPFAWRLESLRLGWELLWPEGAATGNPQAGVTDLSRRARVRLQLLVNRLELLAEHPGQ